MACVHRSKMTLPMLNLSPVRLLIARAHKASLDARTIVDETHTLLGRRADLLDRQERVILDILNAGRTMCETGSAIVTAAKP
jgi:hypothetical protein